MPEKRLFIAVDLTDAARNAIFRVCREMPEYRWTRREQLHLTLRFLGDVDVAAIPALISGLGKVKFPEISLTLTETGFFRPSVFFLSMTESDALSRLKRQVDAVLQEVLGMPEEERDFVPHITLTRFKKRPSGAKLDAMNNAFATIFPMSFTVDALTLYASELTPHGAIHTRIESFGASR